MNALGSVAAVTDPGRKRRHNEDAYVCEPPLFAVADGMGGAQAGEIASRMAAASLRQPLEPGQRQGKEHVVALIQEANRRVYEAAAEDESVSGMGTTMTAAVAEDDAVWIGHVGDSRAYLVRDGRLEQLTEDHSLVAELVRSGKLSPEEAEAHPQRSVITRALGTESDVDVDTFSVQTRPGDLFMLCSDGLTSMLTDEAILDIAERNRGDLARAGKALVDAANKAGGEDNITVVLFEIVESPETEDGGTSGADEQTLTELDAVPTLEHVDVVSPDGEPRPRARRGRSRRTAVAAGALVLLAAAAGAAVWGFSRSYFVGTEANGHVAVYQGVPWNVIGSVHLYRLRYESPMLAAQLSRNERRRLFSHHLQSYGSALDRVKTYEEDAVPR
jgi:protein phosphatase